jgi:putative redox protein
MGIRASDMQIDLRGARLDVTKHMLSDPRRIGKIEVTMHIPSINLDGKDKLVLQKIGDNCPVMKSLHPDLEVVTEYLWA